MNNAHLNNEVEGKCMLANEKQVVVTNDGVACQFRFSASLASAFGLRFHNEVRLNF